VIALDLGITVRLLNRELVLGIKGSGFGLC